MEGLWQPAHSDESKLGPEPHCFFIAVHDEIELHSFVSELSCYTLRALADRCSQTVSLYGNIYLTQ